MHNSFVGSVLPLPLFLPTHHLPVVAPGVPEQVLERGEPLLRLAPGAQLVGGRHGLRVGLRDVRLNVVVALAEGRKDRQTGGEDILRVTIALFTYYTYVLYVYTILRNVVMFKREASHLLGSYTIVLLRTVIYINIYFNIFSQSIDSIFIASGVRASLTCSRGTAPPPPWCGWQAGAR